MWFILTTFLLFFSTFRIYNKFTDDSERRKIFIRYSFTLQTTWWVKYRRLYGHWFFLYKFIILTSNKKINQQEVHQCMTVMSLFLSIKAKKESVIKNAKRENLCEANKAFRGFNRSVLCTHFSRTHLYIFGNAYRMVNLTSIYIFTNQTFALLLCTLLLLPYQGRR